MMRRRAIRATVAVLTLTIGGMLAGCTPAQSDDAAAIESVTFSQYASIPNYDTTQYSTTDKAEIAELSDTLEEHGVTGDYRSRGSACPGSTDTELEYTTAMGDRHDILIQGCDLEGFEAALTDLVEKWRHSRDVATATFSQYAAIPDFDDSEYTTTDWRELARLRDILREYEITADYESAAEPCDGSTSTNVAYRTGAGDEFILDVHGCQYEGFEAAVTDLVNSWREERAAD